MFRFVLFFMTPNLQTKGVKWGCKVIWGQRESLEVMKYPSSNSQLWPETIRTIPKEVFERIYIKRPRPGGQKYHKCRYSVQSIQGQGGEIVFHADMQGLLMGRLWQGQMGDHASRVPLIKIWKKKHKQHTRHYLETVLCLSSSQNMISISYQIVNKMLISAAFDHPGVRYGNLMRHYNIFNPSRSFQSLLCFDGTFERSACCLGEDAIDWIRQLHFSKHAPEPFMKLCLLFRMSATNTKIATTQAHNTNAIIFPAIKHISEPSLMTWYIYFRLYLMSFLSS